MIVGGQDPKDGSIPGDFIDRARADNLSIEPDLDLNSCQRGPVIDTFGRHGDCLLLRPRGGVGGSSLRKSAVYPPNDYLGDLAAVGFEHHHVPVPGDPVVGELDVFMVHTGLGEKT